MLWFDPSEMLRHCYAFFLQCLLNWLFLFNGILFNAIPISIQETWAECALGVRWVC